MIVHDDGTGPALFAGGMFNRAGNIETNGIAKWNGKTWSALGAAFKVYVGHRPVTSLASAVDEQGQFLFAHGNLFEEGELLANAARWNGSQWSVLGNDLSASSSMHAAVHAEAGELPALYVMGSFTTAGGIASHNLAKWAPIADAPLITTQPFSQEIDLGDDAILLAQVWGGDLAYQWFKDGQPLADDDHIGGSTTDTLAITGVTADDQALYHLQAESPCGSVTTRTAALQVICQYDIVPPLADGQVNVDDLLAVLNAWGLTGNRGWIPADINEDGVVGNDDLLSVIGAWGPCP